MSDELLDERNRQADHEMAEGVGQVEALALTAQHDVARLKRYFCEKTFTNCDGDSEQYITAVVSIVGDESLTAFEEQLAKLNLGGRESDYRCAWLNSDAQALPTYEMGLILLSAFSQAALLELRREMQRYLDAGVFPIVGLPTDSNHASSMTNALSVFGDDAHCIQMTQTGEGMSVVKEFADIAINYVESTLMAMTYAVPVCVDPADAICIFSSGKFTRILRFEAATANDLLQLCSATLESNDGEVGVIAAIIAPRSLRLLDIHEVMVLVTARRKHYDSTVIFAAPFSEHRERFVLYVSTCE